MDMASGWKQSVLFRETICQDGESSGQGWGGGRHKTMAVEKARARWRSSEKCMFLVTSHFYVSPGDREHEGVLSGACS